MPPRWTARRDGRVHQLFPCPPEAVDGAHYLPDDAVPLTYRDYFGEGNVEVEVDPATRFDLPLGLVRSAILDIVRVAKLRSARRKASGRGARGGPDKQPDCNEPSPLDEDWDANSDISDSDGE